MSKDQQVIGKDQVNVTPPEVPGLVSASTTLHLAIVVHAYDAQKAPGL